ncbi:MAG: rhomboid family intramembrane serine protease [Planctomycetota bacterium]
MKTLLEQADETPVTLLVALAYVTLAFLTHPFEATYGQHREFGMLVPMLSTGEGCWRLLASTFLHDGIVHLLLNLFGLLSLGPALERNLGSVRFAALYLLSGLGGSLACVLWYEPYEAVLGGSGALFGLVGGVLGCQMQAGRNVLSFLEYDGSRRLLGWLVFAFVLGLLPIVNISNTGHAGGLITGLPLTFLFLAPRRESGGPLVHAWRVTFVALLVTTTMWSITPVTRWDWLCEQASNQPIGQLRSQRTAGLLRAATIAEPAGIRMSGIGNTVDYWRAMKQQILEAE